MKLYFPINSEENYWFVKYLQFKSLFATKRLK
jgi:hypothetical protein